MESFKSRLDDEQAQLEEKLKKLDVFLMSDKANGINEIQLSLLRIQKTAMTTYLSILNERIKLLSYC